MQSRVPPPNQDQHPTSLVKSPLWSKLRLRMRVLLGQLYNLAGVPGLVRNCDYEAGVADAHIRVRVRDLYTIVEVNGLEIFFHRLTGSIDGVGAMSGCTLDSVPESAQSPESSATLRQPSQKRST